MSSWWSSPIRTVRTTTCTFLYFLPRRLFYRYGTPALAEPFVFYARYTASSTAGKHLSAIAASAAATGPAIIIDPTASPDRNSKSNLYYLRHCGSSINFYSRVCFRSSRLHFIFSHLLWPEHQQDSKTLVCYTTPLRSPFDNPGSAVYINYIGQPHEINACFVAA